MSKHTPGPWKRSTRSWGGKTYWVVEDQTGAVICQAEVGFHEYESGSFITVEEEIAANVTLIESAPKLLTTQAKLLAACKEAVTMDDSAQYGLQGDRDPRLTPDVRDMMTAAIAEAEGDTT